MPPLKIKLKLKQQSSSASPEPYDQYPDSHSYNQPYPSYTFAYSSTEAQPGVGAPDDDQEEDEDEDDDSEEEEDGDEEEEEDEDEEEEGTSSADDEVQAPSYPFNPQASSSRLPPTFSSPLASNTYPPTSGSGSNSNSKLVKITFKNPSKNSQASKPVHPKSRHQPSTPNLSHPSSNPPSSAFSPDTYAPRRLVSSFPSPSPFPESRPVSQTPEPHEELATYIAPNGTKAFIRAKGVGGRKIVGGQLQKSLKEVCERLLKEIGKRDDYQFFLYPVSEEEVPGYHSIIKHPMSLSMMKDKLDRGSYRDFDSFEADIRLIFTNCLTFNPPTTIFSTTASKLLSWFERHLPTYRELILPSPGDPGRSRSPSVFEEGDYSPAPSTQAEDDTGPTQPAGSGQNQMGRRRGPYNKSSGGSSVSAAAMEKNASVFDEEGILKGAGMFAYNPVVWPLISRWETGGKRLKNKREIQKLISKGAEFVPCCADGSRDLAELETLTPSLDVFMHRPKAVPRLINIPPTVLAPTTADAQPIPKLIPPPPDDCYLPGLSEELPLAFQSWKPPRSSVPFRPSVVLPKDDSKSRQALATDYAPFPLFPLANCTVQQLTAAGHLSFLQTPLPEPRGRGEPWDDPCLPTVELAQTSRAVIEAKRTAEEEDLIRDLAYGGQLGEAYAKSLERFVGDAVGGKDAVGLNRYMDRFVGTVWKGGALGYLRDVGRVLRDAGGVRKRARLLEAAEDESGPVKEEEADLLMGLSGVKAEPTEGVPPETSSADRPSSRQVIERKIDRAIKDLPRERHHLAAVQSLPLSLSTVLKTPVDLTKPIPPPPPPPSTGQSKRKRPSPAGDSWPDNTLRMVGEELARLAEEREGLPKTETGEEDMGWMEDDSVVRIRLLLLSLARRTPLHLLEKLSKEELARLPPGPIQTYFTQILKPDRL